MKLETKVNFDFNKLANQMPKIIDRLIENYAISAEKGSKENIDKGVTPPLEQSTIDRRRRRNTGGSKPLFETGKMYRSIKGTKQGLEMLKYGFAHHIGMAGKHGKIRKFISASKKETVSVFAKFKKQIEKSLRK